VRSYNLNNTKAVVVGIANRMSIAYGVAKMISDSGGRLVITYADEAYKQKIADAVSDLSVDGIFYYNANDSDGEVALFSNVNAVWPDGFHSLVHSVAWADKSALRGRCYDVSRESFLGAMQVSCYSFIALARGAAGYIRPGGSILTMSYIGSQRVVPGYNTMGICKGALESSVKYAAADYAAADVRVNAISAGPIKTLAAAHGLKDFSRIMADTSSNSIMKRSVTINDVAGTAFFLLNSELSSVITGQVIYADCGYNVSGVGFDDNRD
jgi:enoyl-[acyl-carrier protein] reductase I